MHAERQIEKFPRRDSSHRPRQAGSRISICESNGRLCSNLPLLANCPCAQPLRGGIVPAACNSGREITDSSPRTRKFPKIRHIVLQQLLVIPRFSNGAHFALTK